MLKFDKDAFFRTLREIPKRQPYVEKPQHSEYLQKEVFDKWNRDERVDFKALDWNAFDFCHVEPAGYVEFYEQGESDCMKGIRWFLNNLPASSKIERTFF